MKKFTQFGTFTVIVLSFVLLFCIGMIFVIGTTEPFPLIIMGFVILSLVFCLLLFYNLTIMVDDTHLTFEMGIGLIRKSFPLADIESCVPVKNSAFYGIGIHIIPGGWLYNVSGHYAIELSFRSRKTRIRIGTDRADEIAELVNSRIENKLPVAAWEKTGRSGASLLIIVLVLVFFVPVILILYGSRETEVTFSENSMILGGMYSMTIGFQDITLVDTVSSLPAIKSRTNGFASGRVLKGNFKLAGQSKVKLFIIKGAPPYIVIKTRKTTIYLNTGNPVKTRDIFFRLLEKNGMK